MFFCHYSTLSVLLALGHACAAVSVLVAGLVELHRKAHPLVEQTLSGKVLHVSSMPCFQLAPQYILLGVAEALVTPSCGWNIPDETLSDDQRAPLDSRLLVSCSLAGSLISFQLIPSHIRGISLHFLTLSYGGGCLLGAFIIQLVHFCSEGRNKNYRSIAYMCIFMN